MFDKLDAAVYRDSGEFYDGSFEVLLSKITDCYRLMKSQEFCLENDECKIRDVLFLQYLNNNKIREKLQIQPFWLSFREVLEDQSVGRTDIRIISPDTFYDTGAYYIMECKRLDNTNTSGTSGLNAKYIKEGICRFTEKYYSSYYRINAMIGFVVEKMDVHANTEKINNLIKQFGKPITTKYITKDNFIQNFEYQYHSTHFDSDRDALKIYHLMFEVSENIGIN